MRNTFFITLSMMIVIFSISSVCAQTQWAKTYGGSGDDYPYAIQQTSDGGYIVAGSSDSFGDGSKDFWVLKLYASGDVQWQKAYGGTSFDIANAIQKTSDGGYMVAGISEFDLLVLKLDASGSIQWQKTYDENGADGLDCIHQTSDGGFVLAAFTNWGSDAWVLKLDASGNIQWEKIYDIADEGVSSIQQTSDGGYIVAGGAGTFPLYDFWVFKLDASGGIQWEKTYGGNDNDMARSIQQTGDGGYIVAGSTDSFGAGDRDAWVLKLDASGNVQWEKTYGGSSSDFVDLIQQTDDDGDGVNDDGYVLAGATQSFSTGDWDHWVIKIDSIGNIQWEKIFEGCSESSAHAMDLTSDGGYILAGRTSSYGAGNIDCIIIKLDTEGNIANCSIGDNSTATLTSNSVTGLTSSASVISSSAMVASIITPIINTNAEMDTICEYTLIELSNLSATPGNRDVLIEWVTESEIDNAGFNLYRAEAKNGKYAKINVSLIPAKGSPTGGAAYEFVDNGAKNRKTYWYKLEDVDLNGVSTTHGPVSGTPRLIYGLGR